VEGWLPGARAVEGNAVQRYACRRSLSNVSSTAHLRARDRWPVAPERLCSATECPRTCVSDQCPYRFESAPNDGIRAGAMERRVSGMKYFSGDMPRPTLARWWHSVTWQTAYGGFPGGHGRQAERHGLIVTDRSGNLNANRRSVRTTGVGAACAERFRSGNYATRRRRCVAVNGRTGVVLYVVPLLEGWMSCRSPRARRARDSFP
jgi:hypothetical protein